MTGGQLAHGALGGRTVHLCVDMQVMFAERTGWHLPWMERVLPNVLRLARAHPDRTVFTRFVPVDRPERAEGAWRRYYDRWRDMTLERLDPRMTELVPMAAAFVPPALVVDKRHYSPFVEPELHTLLRRRGVDSLVISGGETDVCVLATALGAVDFGYRVILAADALCSSSDRMHDALLSLYRDRFAEQIEAAPVEVILDQWR